MLPQMKYLTDAADYLFVMFLQQWLKKIILCIYLQLGANSVLMYRFTSIAVTIIKIRRASHFYNGNPYPREMSILYGTGPPVCVQSWWSKEVFLCSISINHPLPVQEARMATMRPEVPISSLTWLMWRPFPVKHCFRDVVDKHQNF